MLHVEKFNYQDLDDLYANTYVVSDSFNNCVVIDPSVDNDGVSNYISKHNLTLKAVLLTHGHFDHIRGVDRFVNVPLYIHQLDEAMLYNSYLNGSTMLAKEIIVKHKCEFIKDNDVLDLLEDKIHVIHTPFHTKGSVCYYFTNNRLLFSGDTLFKGSIGRDDLPNSIPSKMKESLGKLKTLPKDCKIYPGHGSNSTLEFELNYNYFLTR